jgi:hypothetical protein
MHESQMIATEMLLLAASPLQPFGNLVVLAIVAGMAFYGWQNGILLATLAGMGVWLSLVAGLGFAGPLKEQLVGLQCPPGFAFPAAFGLVFLGLLIATRLAIGGGIREGSGRFPALIDGVGGLIVGSLAGWVVAGAVLVAMSILPVPEAARISGHTLRLDAGSWLLRRGVAGSLAEQPADAARIGDDLLQKYASGDWTAAPIEPPPAEPAGASGAPAAEPPADAPATAASADPATAAPAQPESDSDTEPESEQESEPVSREL